MVLVLLSMMSGPIAHADTLDAPLQQTAPSQDADDPNAWHVDLGAGSAVRVRLTPQDGQAGLYAVRVEAPDGSILTTSPAPGDDPSTAVSFTAAASGTYTVHVDVDPSVATALYGLDLEVTDAAAPASAPAAGPVAPATQPAAPVPAPAPQDAGAAAGPASLSIVRLDPPPGTVVPQPASVDRDFNFTLRPPFVVHAEVAFDARALGDAAQLFASYDLSPDGPPINQIAPGPGVSAEGRHVGAASGTMQLDVPILPAGARGYARGVQSTRLRFRLCANPTQPQGPTGPLVATCAAQIASDPYPLAPLREALPGAATPVVPR